MMAVLPENVCLKHSTLDRKEAKTYSLPPFTFMDEENTDHILLPLRQCLRRLQISET